MLACIYLFGNREIEKDGDRERERARQMGVLT